MKITSLKFNNSTIHKMYHGNELVNKIGDAFTYMEASGDTPTPPTPVPYSGQYLTFVAEADNLTIGLAYAEDNVFQYSTDSGATWSDLTNNESTSSVNSGETILFKASGLTSYPYTGIGVLTPSVNARVQGNIMSLVYGDNFARKTSLEIDSQFAALFWRATKLTSAENLIMPATTLRQGCYSEMFNGCTSLTTAPALPATTLANSCYNAMFNGCTSLTTAPELPATTLAERCYSHMFASCTSLTTAPSVLPATTLAYYCYDNMFSGCTSLTTAPELPATTLTNECYRYMFNGCTSLTTAPELPATTLASGCYDYMFNGCTSLATAPELPATTLAQYCYYQMFKGCTSLSVAPELPATTLVKYCYYGMFSGCTNLNSITCLATDKSASNCTSAWVSGVAANGTFVKAATMNDWTTGLSGIPNGWTVQNDDDDIDIPVDGGGWDSGGGGLDPGDAD